MGKLFFKAHRGELIGCHPPRGEVIWRVHLVTWTAMRKIMTHEQVNSYHKKKFSGQCRPI